ncbi:MoaD/ThiS family protein [Spirulina subsalsa]|uniref:MoaD/ThiS family protein n=1 Tax=Spirulina subsalsa TaxID=54311 RepID=UPI0002DE6759|nr:MoaD/ThiS family protein [Spirulina subsalsa]
MIRVKIKLFAAYQEAYNNQSEIEQDFPENTPVYGILTQMLAEHPELEQWRNVTRFGINYKFVDPETVLQDGDEVVLIPPVSGG